tara:strand:+ start:3852 stop:4190 length:339 start_codon:yes stop_codon:yes gene_type:complete
MLFLDTLYLSTIGGKPFLKMVTHIQNKPATVNYWYATVVYILMIFGFYYFIVKKKLSNTEAFMLGVFVYGVFDFTNIALFSNYNLTIAIQDTLWGGILFYLTNILYNYSLSL